MNNSGDLAFEVDNQRSYVYLPDSFLYCEFSLFSDKHFRNPIITADNITLENIFPNLFSEIRQEVVKQSVESISTSPRVIDSLLRYVLFNMIKKTKNG